MKSCRTLVPAARARSTKLATQGSIGLLPSRFFPETLSQNSDVKTRFEREAQTLARLSHPHICPVFDVGRHDGVDYLVMEYIDGETLAERLGGPVEIVREAPERARRYALDSRMADPLVSLEPGTATIGMPVTV